MKSLPDLGCRAAQVAAGHSGFHGHATAAGLAAYRAGAEGLLDVGELTEWDARPVVTVDQETPDGLDIAPVVVLEPDDFADLPLSSKKVIDVLEFVPADQASGRRGRRPDGRS